MAQLKLFERMNKMLTRTSANRTHEAQPRAGGSFGLSDRIYRFEFQSSTNRNIGSIEIALTTEGTEAYNQLKQALSQLKDAAYYQQAISYDKENGIDYTSSYSLQRYLDENKPQYKQASEALFDVQVSGNNVAILFGAKGEEIIKKAEKSQMENAIKSLENQQKK